MQKNVNDNNLCHSLVFPEFQLKRNRKWPLDVVNMNQLWLIKLVQMFYWYKNKNIFTIIRNSKV